jgi:peptidoglycan/xylan/chitin deacetylase (PgdA/CDA1 family)
MQLGSLTGAISTIAIKFKIDSLYRFINRKKIAVFMYHGVVPDDCPIDSWTLVRENEFRKQMNVLSKYYEVVPIGHIEESRYLPYKGKKPRAMITFDDGYRNNCSVAFPILKEYGFPATIFICSGLLNQKKMAWYDKVIYSIQRSSCNQIEIEGKNFSFHHSDRSKRWDLINLLLTYLKKKNEYERNILVDDIENALDVPLDQNECFFFLTDEDVRDLHKSGLITIGAHTANHEILTNVSIIRAEETIRKNLSDLESLINDPVYYFSYPNGNYNNGILKLLSSTPVKAAFTTISDIYSNRYSMFEIPRVGVGGYDHLEHFIMRSCGCPY